MSLVIGQHLWELYCTKILNVMQSSMTTLYSLLTPRPFLPCPSLSFLPSVSYPASCSEGCRRCHNYRVLVPSFPSWGSRGEHNTSRDRRRLTRWVRSLLQDLVFWQIPRLSLNSRLLVKIAVGLASPSLLLTSIPRVIFLPSLTEWHLRLASAIGGSIYTRRTWLGNFATLTWRPYPLQVPGIWLG